MVTFIELVGLTLGGASLFGLIVGAFSVYNGRATRRLILEEERRTQTLISEMSKRLEDLLASIKQFLDRNTEILNRNTEILNKNTEILSRIANKLFSSSPK